MVAPGAPSPTGPPGARDRVEGIDRDLKLVISVTTSCITIGTAITAFVSRVGGLQQFLIEVAVLGFAAYVALFLIVVPLLFLVGTLEERLRRVSTPTAQGVLLAAGAIGGALFVRFKLFDQHLTEELDGVGTAFAVIVGLAVISAPLLALWYFYGSRPASR